MHVKKHLGFNSLRKQLSKRFNQIEDHRQQGKVDYSIHDCCMSGFAMMFFQDTSLLEFQKRMQEKIQFNNLSSMFGVSAIPQDSQLRDVLDEVPSDKLTEVFEDYFRLLQRGKHLETYQFMPGKYLVTLDGTEYFNSYNIHCPSCLWKERRNGKTQYNHQILQAVIVHPDMRQVIPLAPEQIKNGDGAIKQDCEINAGKRLIKKIRIIHPKLGIIIVGDSLYSKQPFILETQEQGISYILVAKPDDHKHMMKWFENQKIIGKVYSHEIWDKKGHHIYEWIKDAPLNGNPDTIEVNFFQYRMEVNGKVTYRNSWITDIEIHKMNVEHMVRGGRSRWKIENEGFNTLKNQGYHIEHNFGHGKNNLSFNFFLLNLLAFFMHQIFEITDRLYKQCRGKFSAKKEFWNQLRCTFRILFFKSWESLLRFIISPSESQPP